MLTARFPEAVEYARAHHADDLRKGTTIPYLAHLLAVSALVLEHGGDETAAMAALLHDVVEDGGGEPALAEIARRFGTEVAAIVEGCSDTTAAATEDWTLRKERYLEHLESAPADVLLVSAADKLHNAQSILSDLAEHGEKLWARFNRGPHEQLWYYGSLRDIFRRRLPGRLADELDRTVRAINRRVDPYTRLEMLGHDFQGWLIGEPDGRAGEIVDWPGVPLCVDRRDPGLLVRAHVGSGGEWYPEDDDMHLHIDADLAGLCLKHGPGENAWLSAEDEGDLREACERVAGLAGTVADQLRESLFFDPPVVSFEERCERGPW